MKAIILLLFLACILGGFIVACVKREFGPFWLADEPEEDDDQCSESNPERDYVD